LGPQARGGRSILKYIGIDGCKAGWFYVGFADDDTFDVGILSRISDAASWIETAKQILIDIPIGLPTTRSTRRECDSAARRMISPRGSTVFPAPARSALSKHTYQAASEENHRCLGSKLSKQTWLIAAKIKEVDDFMRAVRPGSKVRELHPEVAFCGLNGGKPILSSKKTSHGFTERLELLQQFYPMAGAVVDATRRSIPLKKDLQDDDILDALVGAVTASRYPDILTLPVTPPVDDEGLPMEIVYSGGTGNGS
jgi:predicted RNase H-like nuclease